MWKVFIPNLLLISAMAVSLEYEENNTHKETNEIELVPDTQSIDLRNKLDLMTEELLSKGHAYVLNSGIGNREVLGVTSVEQSEEFVGGKEVTEWQSVQSGGQVYLLGKHPTGFVLLASHFSHENKTVQITEFKPDFPPEREITTMTMIERWNATIKTNEVIILLAVKSSTADFIWYRLQNNEVVPFWSWPHYKKVSTVLLFSIGSQYKMLAVNANDGKDSTTAEVYNIVFEQTHSDFSLTHTLALNESSCSTAVSTVGENVFLFVTQKKKGYVLVYKYKYFVSEQYENGHFELHTNLSAPGVTQVVTFHTAYQNYLAFNGDESQIYRIMHSGEFKKETIFGYIRQWVVLPVHNYRSEVILFARESDETKLYAWAGVDNGFSEISLPLCHEKLSADSCFTGIKDGTTSILLYNIPSLIVPMHPDNSIIYHFTTTLQSVKTPVYKIVNGLNEKKNFLEDLWKTQKKNISAVSKSLQYILRNDVSNTVMEKWVLGNLTTSNLINTSALRCGSLGFLTDDSEVYKYVNLDNLESKVDLVKTKLYELGDKIKSTVDLTKFNGVLSVKGHTIVRSLNVSNMNQFSMKSLLHDTLRSDLPRRIVGSKVIRSLKADEMTFSKIKNITALELTYLDNLVSFNINLNIDKPLQVDKDVKLVGKGTVNNIDLSEDICHVDVKCIGNPSFNSLVVNESTVHTKLNGENLLGPLNEDNSFEFNRVFGGYDLTVLNINGRNWSDLANSIVYKDQDNYITGYTTVNGTLYSRDNMKIETLNGLWFPDDYAIINRASQKVTGRKYFQFPVKKPEQPMFSSHTNEETVEPMEAENDKAFIKTKASVRSKVIKLENMMMDDFNDWLKNVDIIFTDAEVTGIVSSSVQSNWTIIAADIVYKDEINTNITSLKTFIDSLKINNNLELSGLIGNKNVSDLLTTDSEQMIEGITHLHGHITFNSVTVNREWDGVRVEILFNDSVKLSANQNLPDLQLVFISDDVHESKAESRNLVVLHSVNNVMTQKIEKAVKNYRLLLSQTVVLNGSLNAINLTVLGDITLKGKMCGWNFADYNSKRFSLSRNEDVTGNISIFSASVSEDLHVENINGMNVSDVQDYLNMDKMKSVKKDVEIMAMHVHGNVSSKQGISHHYNITSVVQHAVWLQNNNYVNSSFTFMDEVICGMMSIHGPVAEQDWNLFAQNVVYKNDTYVTLSGKKMFPSGFSVNGNLDVDVVNGHLFTEIITKTSDQMIEGEINITEDIIVQSIADILGTLNDIDITELSKQCKLVHHDEIKCEGNITFATDISVQELQVSGAVNGEHKFTEFVNTLLFKNSSAQIINEAVFSGDTEFNGNVKIKYHMNKIDWNEFTDNVALMNETNDISESVIFKKKLKVSKELFVNGELNASTVNGYNFTEWADNAMYLDSPLHISGAMCFTDIINKGNISIEWFDKVHMRNIITLNHKDTIFGVFAFKNITAEDLQVEFKVNDVRLDEEYENTLLTGGMQMIESGLSFLGDLSIEGNITASGFINKLNVSNVATVHRNETLNGKFYFTCGIQLQNNLKTTGNVSGINITNWKESAILHDKNQKVEGAVTVLGNITFTQPISSAKSLGDTHLEELLNSVQRNILDIHENMKDNLTEVCGEVEHIVQKARSQAMSIQYFEQSQMIDSSENNIHSVFHFQAYADNFVSVTGSNCTTNIYQWNKTTAQFTKVFVVSMGSFITHWIALAHSNQTYIVTRSPVLVDDKCPYNGTNLWLFNNSTIVHINKLNEKVDAIMTDGNKMNVFYALDNMSVTEWTLNHRAEKTEFMKQNVWPKTLENATFASPASGLGLTLTNGNKIESLFPDNRLLVNISINCTSEKTEYSRDTQQHFTAVAIWEETQIHRHSDFIKIYKKDGVLFDKLTSWKPSHLNWLSLPGQSWLTFIENSTGLQIYNYKGPNEGFKQELSMDVNVTGLLTMTLHVTGKLNTQPYILIYSNVSLYLLQPKVLGDPYVGLNISCHYDDWYKMI